ncbi:MAG: transglutaminase domain-containing protein [Candidatus Coproplasma sp.]
MEIKVYAEGDEEVTSNYEITYVYGELEITPRPVTVESASNSWVYDGEAHSDGAHQVADGVYGLVTGHRTESYNLTQITDVGTAENVLYVKVFDGAENEVTENYEITYVYGELEITPRPVKIVSSDYEWIYDGQSHSYDGHGVDPDGYVELGVAQENYGLVYGHNTVAYDLATIIDVGSRDNVLKVRVLNGYDEDVTSNYEISYAYGTLTVKCRPITVTAGSSTKIYDGMPLRCGDYFVTSEIKLLEGHTLTAETEGSRTDAGESLNVIKEGSVVIKNASGAIVNDYYYVTFESGSLTVSQRPITVVTASNSWVYDGEAHSDGANQVSEGDYGLVEGHYTRSYNLAEIITVGTVENRMDVKVYSEEGEEVTSNYAITYLNGTLAVTSRPIIIETASNSWVYDGQAHSDGTHWVVSGEYGLVGGHRTESYNLTQITDVGTADNVLSVRVFDGGDNEVTENYAITYVYGELEITRRPIIVKTFDYEWVYDGQPHSYDVHEVDPDGYVTLAVDANDYGLVSGHTTLSYNLASITDAGSTPNTMDIIVLYGESVVTDNYEIKGFINGTLTVTPRPITVTADSSTKIYDGTPLTCGTYSVTSELKLVGNHVLTAETEGSQTDAGSSANKITVGSVVIKDASGADMSDNYAVTLNDGTLTVTPRPITITAGSSEKDYDGTPLTYNSFTVTSDLSPALVLNHEAKPEVEGSRTEVGESENVITSVKIFEKVYDGEILTGERDVTANYEIVCKDGLLTVMIPGKLVVKTGDAEKVYDGTVLTCSDYTIIKNTLGQGFGTVYVVVVECTGSITDSGQTQNGCTIKVYSDETELTKYARIAVTHGLLKVIPRPIVISTGSDSWDYDGKTHTCEEYVLSDGYYNEVAYGLVAGHSIAVTDYAKIILPGVKDNTAAVNITAIIDGVEVNVTDNYSITFDLGILEIVSAEQGGDGESAAGDLNTSGIIGGGSLAGGDGEAVSFKVYSEVSGLTYFRLLSYGGYTGVSWSKAVQYGYLVDDTYSANYLAGIALENGGYTRNVMSIEMLTNDYLLPYYTSVNKVGDLSNYDIQTGDVWNKGDASSVYSLYYYLYDYLTDGAESVGSAYSAYEQAYRSFVYEQYLSVPEDTNTYLQSIIAEQGFDAGDSDIIKKVALYIQGSARYNKKYNTALDSESDVVVAFLDSYKEGICQHYASAATLMYRALGIPARYTIGYVGNTSADEWVEIGPNMAHAWTEVFIDGMGWINVEVTGAGAADGSGGSGGSGGSSGSQGQNKELSLKPVDRTKTYDGTPLTANAIEGTDSASSLYLQELLSEGYTFTATFDGSITLPGTEESSIQSLIIKDSNGVQVNDLSVTYETGTLTVVSADAPLIRIYPYALQKCYDGTPLAYGANDYYVSGLPDGWSLDFSLEGISLTEAGVVKSDVLSSDMVTVYNQNGVRQTEEIGYYLSFECTDLLTVDRRCITITSMSDIKEYDGEPLTNSDYWVSVGSLASGHRLQVEVTGTITNIGTTKNTIVGVLITDSDGNDVTACYNIAIVEGVLEVIPD